MKVNGKVKIDVSSSTIDKGLDTAEGFFNKLLGPAVEETGLLFKDYISSYRLNKSIDLLTKTLNKCKQNNINPKTISIKLLYPVLENASLEDDEIMEDKWASLLANLVDSDQNIQNHVFPFILGQISKHEYQVLEKSYFDRIKRLIDNDNKITNLKNSFDLEHPGIEDKYNLWRTDKNNFLEQIVEVSDVIYPYLNLKWDLISNSDQAEEIYEGELEEFEIANLIRLGLVSTIQHQTGHVTERQPVSYNSYSETVDLSDLNVKITHAGNSYILSHLGILFFEACTDKNKRLELTHQHSA